MKIGDTTKINMDTIKKFIDDSSDFLTFSIFSNESDLECRNCYHNKTSGLHPFYGDNQKIKKPYRLLERDSEYGESLPCYEEIYLGNHPTHAIYGYKEILTDEEIIEIQKLVKKHNKEVFNAEYS